jgi:hypothetical protein
MEVLDREEKQCTDGGVGSRGKTAGDWRKVRNRELHDFYCLPHVSHVAISMRK